ncbi:MAG: MBL fold metallo-hydrolase [Evtepia gabavorous]
MEGRSSRGSGTGRRTIGFTAPWYRGAAGHPLGHRTGKQDLSAWVAAQVSTPCIVCNSHGHSDHIGGNFRFPLVYAHPADWPLLAAQARLTGRDWSARPLEPGQRFDLGGREAQVVSLAGHTRGSVGLLLERERLLLAGDALNPTLLMLGPEAGSFSQLRRTLAAAEAMPFDRYLASHTPGPLRKSRWDSICGI